jgi:hypothetical protein
MSVLSLSYCDERSMACWAAVPCSVCAAVSAACAIASWRAADSSVAVLPRCIWAS